jgi:hypothetical protein
MERQYVGIDLHRRRSVIYTMDSDGEKLDCVRIANDPLTLLEVVGKAGPDAEVVIEATYGWYWAVDLLQDAGFRVIWRTRRGTTGAIAGSRTTSATPATWPTCCAWGVWRRPGSRHLRCERRASWCVIGPSSSSCARDSRLRCTQ